MGQRILKKRLLETDCCTLARARLRHVVRTFDRLAVSFSGGKDSTAVLNLALEVCHEVGRLPLNVFFWDEEAIHPETIDYVRRVRQRADISLRWLCLPVTHRNGCSRSSPWWYPWAAEAQPLWCREIPPEALTGLPGFARQKIPDANSLLFPAAGGSVAVLTGIRADESLRRYWSVAGQEIDNYLTWEANGYISVVKPIYDWGTDDVWLAPARFGWDYNHAYDRMEALGIPRHKQRVAPPYGEEPMLSLSMYAACFPELWDRMVRRVPGAATAARYAHTELYAFGGLVLPPGKCWREMVEAFLSRHAPRERAQIAARLKADLAMHAAKTSDPIPEEEHHPLSGVCWKYLAMIASRGDLKQRRSAHKYASLVRDRQGERGTRF